MLSTLNHLMVVLLVIMVAINRVHYVGKKSDVVVFFFFNFWGSLQTTTRQIVVALTCCGVFGYIWRHFVARVEKTPRVWSFVAMLSNHVRHSATANCYCLLSFGNK